LIVITLDFNRKITPFASSVFLHPILMFWADLAGLVVELILLFGGNLGRVLILSLYF
jgi:hypothetical protein